jgi:hypothetical protein
MASYNTRSRRISIRSEVVVESLTDDRTFQQIRFCSTFYTLTENTCFTGLALICAWSVVMNFQAKLTL